MGFRSSVERRRPYMCMHRAVGVQRREIAAKKKTTLPILPKLPGITTLKNLRTFFSIASNKSLHVIYHWSFYTGGYTGCRRFEKSHFFELTASRPRGPA